MAFSTPNLDHRLIKPAFASNHPPPLYFFLVKVVNEDVGVFEH